MGDQVSCRSDDSHAAESNHRAYVYGEDQDHPPRQICRPIRRGKAVNFEYQNELFASHANFAAR